MIRYPPLTTTELETRVDSLDATWRKRAAIRVKGFVDAGKFVKEDSIWSEVKQVFMRMQYNKCIFCERVFGGELTGKAEHDVEHFRPKGRVLKWPYAKRIPKVGYKFSTGEPSKTGYYWLAYNVENYACACKGCNSDRKRDYFPIAGVRGSATASIAELNVSETPLILFPHGSKGDDPADFITFEGVLAIPLPQGGLAERRAQVTIDFFSLNDRVELFQDRARTIRELFKAMRLSVTDPDAAVRQAAQRDIDIITSDAAPQAGCARAYLALAKSDPDKAFQIYLDIERNFKGPNPA